MNQETILLINHDEEVLSLLKSFLPSISPYKISQAGNVQQGLEMADQSQPDVILVDMELLPMDGMVLLEGLRMVGCHAPIILLASRAAAVVPLDSLRLGVRDYLIKPFSRSEFLETLDRALRESRLSKDRDKLNHGLLTAEAIRVTVITLSHYLNNYLTSLKGGLALMKESLAVKEPDPDLESLLKTSLKSALSIQALMKVLLETTDAHLIGYTATTPMINIEDALRSELNKMPEFLDLDGD